MTGKCIDQRFLWNQGSRNSVWRVSSCLRFQRDPTWLTKRKFTDWRNLSMKSGERKSSLIASDCFSSHLPQYKKPFSFSSGFWWFQFAQGHFGNATEHHASQNAISLLCLLVPKWFIKNDPLYNILHMGSHWFWDAPNLGNNHVEFCWQHSLAKQRNDVPPGYGFAWGCRVH